jgi:hypothetical protein
VQQRQDVFNLWPSERVGYIAVGVVSRFSDVENEHGPRRRANRSNPHTIAAYQSLAANPVMAQDRFVRLFRRQPFHGSPDLVTPEAGQRLGAVPNRRLPGRITSSR